MRKNGNGVSKIRDKGYGPNWRTKTESFKDELGRKCSECGNLGSPANKLASHHLVSKARGGPDSLANIIILCERCHSLMHPGNKLLKYNR